MDYLQKLQQLWHQLYQGQDEKLESFLKELQEIKLNHFSQGRAIDTTWYKDAIVYSAYADLFNRDLNGLQEKIVASTRPGRDLPLVVTGIGIADERCRV